MPDIQVVPEPITEDWLRQVGFKWHTVRGCDPNPPQDPKHWTLWMGGVAHVDLDTGRRQMFSCDEDLGLEISAGFRGDLDWFCWLRADTSHRYSRFLHIRHIRHQHEVVQLVEALSGVHWNPANHLYGKIFSQADVASIRKRDERLDVKIAQATPWSEREKDDSAGREVAK